MRAVKRQDTAPELAVRRVLHAAGLRYRLHADHLPGTPDIVLPRRGTVIFVHGCFWHGHHCRHGQVAAKTNALFWAEKIEANRRRDARKCRELRQLGWAVETVWECSVGKPRAMHALTRRLLAR